MMMRQPEQLVLALGVLTLCTISNTNGFSLISRQVTGVSSRQAGAIHRLAVVDGGGCDDTTAFSKDDDEQNNNDIGPSTTTTPRLSASRLAATAAVGTMLGVSSLMMSIAHPAYADEGTSPIYSDDAVVQAVNSLDQAKGDSAATMKAYETVAGIITEGKGVGGQIDYKGVQLNRGYVADEDTSIYNPGLTLLTESEKTNLVNAVVAARKSAINVNSWTDDNQFAYDFLKQKLDPLHMVELRGYLSIVPFYVAVLYGATIGVQQFKREAFTVSYIVAAAAFFLPVFALLAIGP